MQRGTTVEDPELPVQLGQDEMLTRSKTLAEKVGYREHLVESAKSDAKKWKGQIDEVDEEIACIARVIRDGFENKDQMDLFADQKLAKDEAASRLTEIAKRAERHPFILVPPDGVNCGREGCGAERSADVHTPPAPTERHTFVPDGTGEGKCWACPAPKDDAVHAMADGPKPSEPHAFAPRKSGMLTCDVCGADGMDPVHVPRDATETSTPGEVGPEESVAAAKEHITGGNGKGPIARARSRTKRPPERKHGKAARV